MLEEGTTYEVASVVDRGERGFIIAGKPVIGFSGGDLGWSPRRFQFVSANAITIEMHEAGGLQGMVGRYVDAGGGK